MPQGRRWYDHEPTISMAVSLLMNASELHQKATANYVFSLLQNEHRHFEEEVTAPVELAYLFPFNRRRREFSLPANKLIEVLKRLPDPVQMEMSLHIIHCLYGVETGDFELDFETETLRPSSLLMTKAAASK